MNLHNAFNEISAQCLLSLASSSPGLSSLHETIDCGTQCALKGPRKHGIHECDHKIRWEGIWARCEKATDREEIHVRANTRTPE